MLSATNLTKYQLLMWMGEKLHAGRPVYNMITTVHLPVAVDPARFSRAAARVVRSTDALRTVIREAGGVPRRETVEPGSYTPDCIDLSGSPDPEGAYRDWKREREARLHRIDERMFDLALVRLAPDHAVFWLNQHHLICDGWSTALIYNRLAELYETDRDPAGPYPSFESYAREEREYRHSERYVRAREFWADQGTGLRVPAPYGNPVADTATETRRLPCALGSERSERLRELAEHPSFASLTPHLSLLNVFLTAQLAYLCRVTGERDLGIGVPLHNRPTPSSRETAGLLMEICPVRVEVDPRGSFAGLASAVRARAAAAFPHYAFSTGNPVGRRAYQSVLNFHNSVYRPFDGKEVRVEWLQSGHSDPGECLALQVEDFSDRGELGLLFDVKTDAFPGPLAERSVEHFVRLLDAMLDDPEQPILRPEIAVEADLALQSQWNKRRPVRGDELPLHRRFECRVDERPDAVALRYRDRTLTYRQLDERANRLAHFLVARGIGPETLVALYMERSDEAVVAILAVLKAGGAYVPLDPRYPASRVAFVLEDTRAPVILTSEALAGRLPTVAADVICPDRDGEAFAAMPETRPPASSGPEHTAYVIYTSGSTGAPKGVPVAHRNVTRLFDGTRDWYAFGPEDRWTLFHSLAFDFSVWELWGALAYGGTLVVVPHEVAREPVAFRRLVIEEGVTILNQTPSAFRAFAACDQAHDAASFALREVVFGGEALEPASLASWVARYGTERPRLVNMYGITETTVHVTYRPLSREDVERGSGSPIGIPLPDLSLFVLGPELNREPVGVAGELFVSGAGLARGYLARPALTAERFVPDPFRPGTGARLYRTGDVARFTPDGGLDYLGRADDQVKIRGFRIELGEIEAALTRCRGVGAALVIARDKGHEKALVAYWVAEAGTGRGVSELRADLAETLPEYMIPGAFVELDEIPLTAHGKVDRGRLPEPSSVRPDLDTRYVAPRTDAERDVARVWEEVLRLDRLGVQDHFFELGGSSLEAIEVANRLRPRYGAAIDATKLFQFPVLSKLAATLAPAPGPAREAAGRIDERARKQRETFAQNRARKRPR